MHNNFPNIFVSIIIAKYSAMYNRKIAHILNTRGIDMFDYSPLWETLKRKGITQYQLIHKHDFSTGTLDALRKK